MEEPQSLRQRHYFFAPPEEDARLVTIAGSAADFCLCPTAGLGLQEDITRAVELITEKLPDVVVLQTCPTRVKLFMDRSASVFSLLESRAKPQFGRWWTLVWSRLVWNWMGALTGHRRALLGQEYVELMKQVAQMDIRVVLGDRDLPTTIDRAWRLLGHCDRLCLVVELLFFSLLPVTFSSERVALDKDKADAPYEVLRGLVARYPSLSPLLNEQLDYVLSSLQRLDVPQPDGGRALVLAVLGDNHLQHVVENFYRPVNRRSLSSKDRLGLAGSSSVVLFYVLCFIILGVIAFIIIQTILLFTASSSDPRHPQKILGGGFDSRSFGWA